MNKNISFFFLFKVGCRNSCNFRSTTQNGIAYFTTWSGSVLAKQKLAVSRILEHTCRMIFILLQRSVEAKPPFKYIILKYSLYTNVNRIFYPVFLVGLNSCHVVQLVQLTFLRFASPRYDQEDGGEHPRQTEDDGHERRAQPRDHKDARHGA